MAVVTVLDIFVQKYSESRIPTALLHCSLFISKYVLVLSQTKLPHMILDILCRSYSSVTLLQNILFYIRHCLGVLNNLSVYFICCYEKDAKSVYSFFIIMQGFFTSHRAVSFDFPFMHVEKGQ